MERRDTGMRGFNIARIAVGFVSFLTGGLVVWMFSNIPEFWENATALGIMIAVCILGIIAFVLSFVAAFTHKKVLVGHIVLNLVSQTLLFAAIVMAFVKAGDLAESIVKGILALWIWMTHSVVLSILTLSISPKPKKETGAVNETRAEIMTE